MTNPTSTIKTYRAVITYRVSEGTEDFIYDALQEGMDFEEEEGITSVSIEEVEEEPESEDFTDSSVDGVYFESPRSYCLECGKDFEWFMHNCARTIEYNEVHGCPSCDDHCDLC